MRVKLLIKILVVVVITTAYTTIGSSFETGSLTIQNMSGMSIYYVYASPTGQNAWSDNLIEGTFMGFYIKRTITLEHGTYDIKVMDFNKEIQKVYTNITIPSINKITIQQVDWKMVN